MRIGYFLPQVGPVAGPEAMVAVARRAEELGYDSLWVSDRLLYPRSPRSKYPASRDGSLPEPFRTAIDPIAALTFAAAHTSRIALGTSVLVLPYYNPVLLARGLTAIDVLSGGRLRVGLGVGWSEDEFNVVGVPRTERGRRSDELILAMKAIWSPDPVEFNGRFYQIPRSDILPKPVQSPHPPLYWAGFRREGMRRALELANGWHPGDLPLATLARLMERFRRLVEESGRDPAGVPVSYRAFLRMTDRSLGPDRWVFSGSPDEIASDVSVLRSLGVDEVCFDPTFSEDGKSVEAFLARLESLRVLLDQS